MLNAKTTFSRRIVPWLALGGLITLASMVIAPFLAPIAWAGVLAYASWPLAEKIRRWCTNKDTFAALLATTLLGLTLFLPLIWLIWLAQLELGHLLPALQTFLANPPPVPETLRQLPWIGDWLMQQHAHLTANPHGASLIVKTWLAEHKADLSMVAGGLGKSLAKMIFVVVILFFFFRDGTRIMRELRHVLERFIGANAHDYLHAAGTTTRAVVYGILLTALVQGIVAGLGYWVAGLSSPVMFGVLTMILALIPFGTPLAWGAAGLLLLLQGETSAAIGVWIWGAAIVSQLDNVLRPLFISSISPIPFLLVLFGVLGGLLAFGLVGLFIGPIVLSVVWAVWREWTAHLDEDELIDNEQ
ncbi:MAG: AI-2E family transporter [Methylotenera sp.]|uniref:AI-2E family transporter n=1 Tax=Methylotenera sp. TaxID=2051956 RepID=UPI00248A692F|nr:AI-2E family transporter [Methylotenera sp.]MDI1308803.1 AI-2E family transporter [Methylotenera sp.]